MARKAERREVAEQKRNTRSGDDPPVYRERETRAARAGFALPAAARAPRPLRVKK